MKCSERGTAPGRIRIETWEPFAEGTFRFGSMYEGALQIERGERAHVRTYVHEKDAEEILKSIRDASRRSDLTLFSLHTHEGIAENWYAQQPPEFIEKIARDAIDADADAVIGHGAHFLRGVEIYKGRPIFYNLGSLLMEFEAGESIIAPEMYESYGYSIDSRPSDLHANRAKTETATLSVLMPSEDSRRIVWCSSIWKTGTVFQPDTCRSGHGPGESAAEGLPYPASPGAARQIAENLTKYSERYGTEFVYDETKDRIVLK